MIANFKVVWKMVKQLRYILNKRQQVQCIRAFIAMLVAAIFETLGISVVIPFIIALTQPETLLKYKSIRAIVDFLNIKSTYGIIFLMAIGVILVYLVKNIIILFSNYIQIRFRNQLENDLSVLMLDSYMKRPYTFFLNINSGDILRGINSDISGVAQIVDGFFGFLSESITFFLIGFFLIYLNPIIAIGLILSVSLCSLLIVLGFKSTLNMLGKEVRQAFAKKFAYANQAICGIKEITIMQRRRNFTKLYKNASNLAANCNISYQMTSKIPSKVTEVVFIAAIVLLCSIGMQGNIDILTIIPQLSAIAIACVRVLPAVSAMTASINTLVYYRVTLESASENIREAADYEEWLKEYRDTKGELEQYQQKEKFEEYIEIDHISWHYSGATTNVLDDLSIKIQRGESVALIGESGAGKSTLADIILGVLKPQKGNVYVDGLDIFAMPKNWSKLIGYVPQTVFLVDDTIRNNVAFGLMDEEIRDEQVWKALDEAQLKKFVESLPDGLDTIVGERGIKFSGGQRQRVAIARALYHNPQILILDEATSALDNDTETAVMEAIDALQGQKTLIIVAHRLSTIRNCNKVFEIKEGKAILQ